MAADVQFSGDDPARNESLAGVVADLWHRIDHLTAAGEKQAIQCSDLAQEVASLKSTCHRLLAAKRKKRRHGKKYRR